MYSDNGEFKCTAFLHKVAQIAEELNLTVVWNFTCPGHGKGKHDGVGHVMKTECRSAVIANNIQYNKSVEPYSETIVKHMQQHFNNQNCQFAMDRKFYSVPESEYVHYKAKEVCRTFDGITNYYSFILSDTKKMHYRSLTCHCDSCISCNWSQCIATDICGRYKPKDWKPIISTNMVDNVVIEPPVIENNNHNQSVYNIQTGPPPLINVDINTVSIPYNRHPVSSNYDSNGRYVYRVNPY